MVRKFLHHFASKNKTKRSAAHLLLIRQGEWKSLRDFINRFNNQRLKVQDLNIDMMISILIHGLKKRAFASALVRDPPLDTEHLMEVAQLYIHEEEMIELKDLEWTQRLGVHKEKKDDRELIRTRLKKIVGETFLDLHS